MMREIKDHEMVLVVGGRAGEVSGDALDIGAVKPQNSLNLTDLKRYMVPAKAAPFLLPQNHLSRRSLGEGGTRPPKNLPGGQTKQTQKGGAFTFKSPYLNR